MKPTPGPWKLNETGFTVAARNERVASCRFKADASHIVKCVNMHDEMVEALMAVVRMMESDPSFDFCKRLIAKATATKATKRGGESQASAMMNRD